MTTDIREDTQLVIAIAEHKLTRLTRIVGNREWRDLQILDFQRLMDIDVMGLRRKLTSRMA